MTKFEQLLASVDALRALIVEAAKETPPTVRVLVMPPHNSKEEFALSAMAEAMGLSVAEAILAEPVSVEEQGEPSAVEQFKEALHTIAPTLEEPEVVAPPEEPEEPEEPKPVEETKEDILHWDWRKDVRSNVADKDATTNGLRISKKTGKPVRKYERSGKFATKAATPAKKPYHARRMS